MYEIADGAVSPLNHVADGSKTLIWLGGSRLVSQHGELTQARPLALPARPTCGALCERLGGFVRRVFIFNSIKPTTEPRGAARQL